MKVLWWAAVVVAVVAVAVTALFGVVYHQTYGDLEHDPAYAFDQANLPVTRAAADGDDDGDLPADASDEQGEFPDIDGAVGGIVTNLSTGKTVWQQNPDKIMVPASSTKVLTATAAVATLDMDKTLTTSVERDGETVIIRAAGDVWLDRDELDRVAGIIGHAEHVIVDTSIWSGPDLPQGWDAADIDGGFSAPLQPAMIHGARLGANTGDVPRSHQPARDVAAYLANKVEASDISVESSGAGHDGASEVATLTSPPLRDRLEMMMRHSDNVMAEAIGREVALARGVHSGATVKDAVAATLASLKDLGIDTKGVDIHDNSGLSRDNRLPPRVLAECLSSVANHDAPRMRALLDTLAVAGGEGTLDDRFSNSPGRGYVRAKTGTLTETSALAGIVNSESGQTYSFALLVNDAPVLPARAQLDEFASYLRGQ